MTVESYRSLYYIIAFLSDVGEELSGDEEEGEEDAADNIEDYMNEEKAKLELAKQAILSDKTLIAGVSYL